VEELGRSPDLRLAAVGLEGSDAHLRRAGGRQDIKQTPSRPAR
jgi:hypothetical protein